METPGEPLIRKQTRTDSSDTCTRGKLQVSHLPKKARAREPLARSTLVADVHDYDLERKELLHLDCHLRLLLVVERPGWVKRPWNRRRWRWLARGVVGRPVAQLPRAARRALRRRRSRITARNLLSVLSGRPSTPAFCAMELAMSSSIVSGFAGADDLVITGGLDAALDAAAWLMRAPAIGSELELPPVRLSIWATAASAAIWPTDLTSPTHLDPCARAWTWGMCMCI